MSGAPEFLRNLLPDLKAQLRELPNRLLRTLHLRPPDHRGVTLDVLRARLHKANERVAQCQRIASGWREITNGNQTESVAGTGSADLLEEFQKDLRDALMDRERANTALTARLCRHFAGVHGRPPNTDHELEAWLASPEGKAATAFEPM
jgi:hypothetical protein